MKKKIASILLLLTTVAVPAICDDTQNWSVTGISTDATSALGYSAATTGDDDDMDGVKQILFNKVERLWFCSARTGLRNRRGIKNKCRDKGRFYRKPDL